MALCDYTNTDQKWLRRYTTIVMLVDESDNYGLGDCDGDGDDEDDEDDTLLN